MISEKDIKKLSDLARIEINEKEQKELAQEIDQILEYVGQVSKVVSGVASLDQGEVPREAGGGVLNVMREDIDPTESETYSKDLTEEFPHKEKNYLKVKKIL